MPVDSLLSGREAKKTMIQLSVSEAQGRLAELLAAARVDVRLQCFLEALHCRGLMIHRVDDVSGKGYV